MHIVAKVQDLGHHVQAGSFDCVVMNGVIGFGLDAPAEVDKAIAAIASSLRVGGMFVLGWDDVDAHRVALPEQFEALAAFTPFAGGPLGAFRTMVPSDTRKTYDFYLRA